MEWVVNTTPQPLYPRERGVELTVPVPVPVHVVITASGYSYSR
jgi:hypothetical protein